jgi:branched-chain amino acid transport system permease protein
LVIEGSSVFVKLCYSGLFLVVVIALLIITQKALYSPWGRMMRAIRDNEEAANAMGKNVVKQHLLIFILGSGYSRNSRRNVSYSRRFIYPRKL